MRCAEIDPETGAIINVIVADPPRDQTKGTLLVATNDAEVTVEGNRWDGERFVVSERALAERETLRQAVEREAWADA